MICLYLLLNAVSIAICAPNKNNSFTFSKLQLCVACCVADFLAKNFMKYSLQHKIFSNSLQNPTRCCAHSLQFHCIQLQWFSGGFYVR
nr:MAG TPA: hypothetical protein [Caudoviricetes sp.]